MSSIYIDLIEYKWSNVESIVNEGKTITGDSWTWSSKNSRSTDTVYLTSRLSGVPRECKVCQWACRVCRAWGQWWAQCLVVLVAWWSQEELHQWWCPAQIPWWVLIFSSNRSHSSSNNNPRLFNSRKIIKSNLIHLVPCEEIRYLFAMPLSWREMSVTKLWIVIGIK